MKARKKTGIICEYQGQGSAIVAIIFKIAFSIFVFSSLLWAQVSRDSENCLLCHQLSLFILGDSTGSNIRSLEISPIAFAHSTHARLDCRDCHTGITQFPHKKNVKSVDCSKVCHLREPFSLKPYSHKEQVKSFQEGAHSYKSDLTPVENRLKPTCKYCHYNKSINLKEVIYTEETRHCLPCHQRQQLSSVLLHVDSHLSHRTARNSLEIVKLCTSCHADESRMIHFDVNVTRVAGYNRHFHGKALRRGLDFVANCADCHTGHRNLPARDKRSTVNPANVVKTCSQSRFCHPNATQEFAKAAIHTLPGPGNRPYTYFVELGFFLLTAGTMTLLLAHIFFDLVRWVVNGINRKKRG